ncbi:MAG: glutathione S-transferase family protein [Pseudomonadota bacterium]
MQIYGDLISGNCLKVKYTADWLGLDYDWVDVDIMQGQSRTDDFLTHNPAGQVPTVVFADGRALAQSNAIIRYLARDSALLPADAFERAKVDEWLFWEQYSHEPYVAVCRFQMVYEKRAASERDAWRVERGEAALDLLERTLSEPRWLVADALSVADISLYGYTALAHEGGFDLTGRPGIAAWLDRTRGALGLG